MRPSARIGHNRHVKLHFVHNDLYWRPKNMEK